MYRNSDFLSPAKESAWFVRKLIRTNIWYWSLLQKAVQKVNSINSNIVLHEPENNLVKIKYQDILNLLFLIAYNESFRKLNPRIIEESSHIRDFQLKSIILYDKWKQSTLLNTNKSTTDHMRKMVQIKKQATLWIWLEPAVNF